MFIQNYEILSPSSASTAPSSIFDAFVSFLFKFFSKIVYPSNNRR